MKHLIASLFSAALISSSWAAPPSFPVFVGGEADLDACGSWGVVTGIKTFLAVRAGPDAAYPQLDALHNGQALFLCTSTKDGEWLGVVYSPPNAEVDCGVSSPIAQQRVYDGPCRSGWVHQRWVKMLAG